MRNISDTIARLSAFKGHALPHGSSQFSGRLRPIEAFGSNPGNLRCHAYVPANLAERAPLVVVLHGCTQSAGGYDHGSGWSQMADRHGFALLFPEQQRQNNPNLCFNWFSPEDSRRDCGEALSIRQMIKAFEGDYPIDADRVYVTGLSAGGAMASVMLAAYPEVFAGGAIIAGLAYGCAASVPQAFDRMRGHGIPAAHKLAALVRGASRHQGRWPSISVWQGSADATVSPLNADAIVGQWAPLHGVGTRPDFIETVDGHQRRVWRDADGRDVIEAYSIAGMAHGTPLATSGVEGCGSSGAYMLEAGISSTGRICQFWGLTQDSEPCFAGSAARQSSGECRDLTLAPSDIRVSGARFIDVDTVSTMQGTNQNRNIREVIERALRTAGLMR